MTRDEALETIKIYSALGLAHGLIDTPAVPRPAPYDLDRRADRPTIAPTTSSSSMAGEAGDIPEALAQLDATHAHLAVIDISLGKVSASCSRACCASATPTRGC